MDTMYRKKAKEKTMKHSVLEKIDGIGQKKAIALLSQYRTVARIKEASVEELMQVKGIGAKDAQSIYDYYHKEKEDKK